jgi:hypothetical protein
MGNTSIIAPAPFLIVVGLNNYKVKGGTRKEAWIVHPLTRERLRVIPTSYSNKILDIYACDSGIYHASEIITPKQKRVDGIPTTFNTNAVQIVDSISMNSCMTIVPKDTKDLPLEKRLISLDFQFLEDNQSLKYVLNDDTGVIFSNCARSGIDLGNVTFDKSNIYFNDKRITVFDGNVFYAKLVGQFNLGHEYRVKNKQAYKKHSHLLFG